jgi:hypothetical protein
MADYNFLCCKCGIIVLYQMNMQKSAKTSTDIICRCPQCKHDIMYSDIIIGDKKCQVTTSNVKNVKK